MTTRRVRALASTVVLLGAFSLSGCGGNDDSADGDRTAPAPSASPTQHSSAEVTASSEALVKAVKLVLDAVPGSTLTSVELDDGAWEVQVAADDDGTGNEAVVDAAGSEITRGPTAQDDDREDQTDNARLVAGATVDYAVAARTVAAAVPGSLTGLDLDDYRGEVVWEGHDDSRPTVSVRVNAGDGRVIVHGTASSEDDD